jgi:fructose-1-phosphate kinase PfkB-like protein
MADVVTLTMNPAIDLSVSVERVTPFSSAIDRNWR